MTTTERIRMSDYEWFDVTFDDTDSPAQIVHSQVQWSPSLKFQMSARMRHVISLARKQREGRNV